MNLLKEHHVLLNVDKIESLTHNEISFVKCDITDYEKLKQVVPENIDFVVLLAAEHKDDAMS